MSVYLLELVRALTEYNGTLRDVVTNKISIGFNGYLIQVLAVLKMLVASYCIEFNFISQYTILFYARMLRCVYVCLVSQVCSNIIREHMLVLIN